MTQDLSKREISCPKTFTVHMIRRAIASVYNGDQVSTSAERATLWRFWRCSRYPDSKPYELEVWRSARHANWVRRHPPVTRPESELAVCIIYRESRGDPEADNGSHFGVAQWTISSWLGGGGGRYASTPLEATYSQQVTVLNDMLPAQADQWTPWDGCT